MPASAKPMTSDSEARLLAALETVADRVKEGAQADQAVADAVTRHGVPAGHVAHVCRAWNVGRTRQQARQGETVWDKAASFDLADPSRVLELLYPEPKQAAEPVDPSYQLPGDFLTRAREQAEKRASLAAFDLRQALGLPPAQKQASTPARAFRSLLSDVQRLESALIAERGREQQLLVQGSKLAADLASYFVSGEARPYQEVLDNCLARYGGAVQPLFDQAATARPEITRVNPCQAKKSSLVAVGPAYGLVDDAMRVLEEHTRCRASVRLLSGAVKVAYEEYEKVAYPDTLGPQAQQHPVLGRVPVPQSLVPTTATPNGMIDDEQEAMEEAEEGEDKAAGIPGTLTSNVLGLAQSQLRPMPEPSSGNLGAGKLLSQQSAVDAVGREEMLHNLLSQDDVISGHDPRQAVQAYQEFSSLAPLASQQPSLMRDFVRKRLEGGPLSYFDLKALTDIEKNLRQSQTGRFGSDV